MNIFAVIDLRSNLSNRSFDWLLRLIITQSQ